MTTTAGITTMPRRRRLSKNRSLSCDDASDKDLVYSDASTNTHEAKTIMAEPKATQGMLHLMENLIPKYDGQDKTYPAQRWVQDIEDNGEIFDWSPTQKLLVARRSLTGTAALWLRAEKTFKTWEELKTALSKEFPDSIDSKAIHELMSSKKKKPDERCIDYMFAMKELGKRGKMPDYVAIKYVVDGITDVESNKIMLYGVTTYGDLKEKLKIYEIIKSKMKCKEPAATTTTTTTSKQRSKRVIRCYSCGEMGHASFDCPSKSKGLKCFKCNEFGHVGSACITKKPTEVIGNNRPSGSGSRRSFVTSTGATPEGAAIGDSDNSSSLKMAAAENCHGGEYGVYEVNKQKQDELCGKKPIKWVKLLCGYRVKYVDNSDSAVVDIGCGDNALIDSGSEINLISSDFYKEIGSPQCNQDKDITLTGLGSASVQTLGSFSTDIEIDNRRYSGVRFYIITRDSMTYKLILGHEFLQKVVTIMRDGCVWMKPNDSWISEIECFQCSVDLGHVLEEDVRLNVARLVDEYKPCQTKEAPIELKITLKDDIPVASRPRRVSPIEQRDSFTENREELRINAKKQILYVQEENKKNFDRKRKPSNIYQEGEPVCIKRTQFGTGMKLKPKFLGPYKITKVKRNNRYDVEKADSHTEGPNKTTTSSDYMKPWPD